MKKTISLVLVLALALTGEVANADFTFGEPTNLGPTVNSSSGDYQPSISADGLSLFFESGRPGGSGQDDLWVTTRDAIDDEWSTPMNLGPKVNSSTQEGYTTISADGLTLYFGSTRPGGSGRWDLWVTTRVTKEDEWGTPVNLGPTVNSPAYERGLSISADGLVLFFGSDRPGGYGSWDLWVTTRATTNDAWGQPANLGPAVNSSSADAWPELSADALLLFFGSERPGGSGGRDIYVAIRETIDHEWGTPINLGPTVNTSATDSGPFLSADGLSLFFGSSRPGGSGGRDLWQVSISPVVDFNGDGIVDCADMCIMVDHWGTDEPLCDIGPTPFGDGIVDVQDLIVLAEHLFTYPGAVAYWKLDETEGMVAYDSAGENDAYLIGDPIWQPEGGMIDGALELDGIYDYVSTPVILDPAEGDFSVFAWIKGGAPGQVILSQESGVNWLAADAVDGALKTDLRTPEKPARIPIPPGPPLISPTVVTDGDWHRVGFVRDGSDRILYVDDIEVARDTATNLESASGGLYIGTGKAREAGSFWSGLIDDVRIYNRAVTP